MILRPTPFALLVAGTLLVAGNLLLGGAAWGGEADDKDRIVRKNGASLPAYVESENAVDVLYRSIRPPPGTSSANANKLKVAELDHIVYYGMDSGHWSKGVEDRETGNYDSAAEHFAQLVETGTREWEKVYGAINEGECFELGGHFAEAAKAYGLVVTGYAGNPDAKPPVPPNRFWLDSKYHYGMCLAQAKSPDADKVADELEALGKKDNVLGAETRANAVRAAIAGAQGNLANFTGFMKKVLFRSQDEREVWFHFKLYCAESLRLGFKNGKEAAKIYREILTGLGNDPSRQAQVSLGLGLCLMDNDRQGALIELLKLDALPFGSADQKCEARFNAGRLLWDEAQTLKNITDFAKDERRVAFVKDTERTARLIVAAAAEGPVKNPNVALAKSLLSSFGPDPDAPKAAPGAPGTATAPEPKK
jgi:tetratricopeptide (TPR) repeat protein